MVDKPLKWYERSRDDDGHIEQVYLKSVTAKQLAEINVCDWIEGFGTVDSYAVQKFIRKYGNLLFKLHDDPEYDGTDFAHPAFFRGSHYSLWEATRLIVNVLSGKDTGQGFMNEPAGSLRNLVLDLKRVHDIGWDRVSTLEEENGLYFEQKTNLEEENKRLTEELRLANERLSNNG